MHNKFFLFFFFLLGIYSNSTQTISPNIPGALALSSFAAGAIWAGLADTRHISAQRFIETILGSGLIYYITQHHTPHNKFAEALKIKKNVENDKLFRFRKGNNAALREILNMHKEDYPCLLAIKTLYNLFTDLESACKSVLSAPADLLDDIVFEQQCKELAGQIEYMQNEIKIFTKRIMRTVQWYNEVNSEDDNLYLDSVTWSTNLISPEVSIKIHTYRRINPFPFRDEHVTNSRLSFREIFLTSLVDLTE